MNEGDQEFDAVRRCSLRWPLWLALDAVATEQNPLMRCVVVAKALGPLRDDPHLGPEVLQTILALRTEAEHRKNGTRPAVPALVAAPRDAAGLPSKEKSVA